MKPSHILGTILLLAARDDTALVRAADCLDVALSAIPSCAQSCFLDGAPSVGCSGTDFACQCAQEARLYAAIEGCVSTGCPSASYQAVIDGASTVCGCATTGSGGVVGSMTVSGTVVGSLPATTTASGIGGGAPGTVIPQTGGGDTSITTTAARTTAPSTTAPPPSTVPTSASGAGKAGLSVAASSVVVALFAFISL